MLRPTQKPLAYLATIFIVGLMARVAFALSADTALKNDESVYVEIALNVLAGGNYESRLDLAAYGLSQVRPPFLPWLIMCVFRIAGTDTGLLRTLLAVFSSLVVIPSYLLARNLGGSSRCSLTAALIIALHPPLVVNASRVLTEAPFAILITTLSALVCSWRRSSSTCLPILTGVVAGMAILCRATILPFLPLLAAAWAWSSKDHRRWWGLLAAIAALFTILPWQLSLFREHQRIIPVSTGGGFNLWCVNNPYMKGIPGVTPPTKEIRADLARLPEAERDAYYQRLAIDWARENPREFLQRRRECLVEFWRLMPADLWNRRYPFKESYGLSAPPWFIVAAKTMWFSLLIGALAGSIVKMISLSNDHRPEILSLVALIATATLVHTVMISFPRYRMPFDPTWMTLGVLAWCDFLARQRNSCTSSNAAP